ncbi:MAG: hypothetical protein ABWK00_03700 [Desulfurococcaceae archaeon]
MVWTGSARELVREFLELVPEIGEFMTVDELSGSARRLAREHGDVAEVVEAGKSRSGDAVEALVMRGGEDVALAFGFPHPNEPVGSMTLEVLSWALARRRDLLRSLGITWVIVKVADVYGARLNEGWFKGPFDVLKYAKNYYRPPGYKQVEWSFPIKYKDLSFDSPTPETRAIMKLIDEWRPSFVFSLHNAGFTGTYYYVSREPGAEVLEILYEVPRSLGVPVHRGEPEAPYMTKLAEGVFRMPSVTEIYDWLERNLGSSPVEALRHGAGSYDYARRVRPDVFELVSEVPYIYDARLDNDTKIGVPRREVLKIGLARERGLIEELRPLMSRLEPHASPDNPFFESLKNFVEIAEKQMKAEERWIESDPSLDSSATVAQAFDAYNRPLFGAVLRAGLLYRAAGLEASRGSAELRDLEREALGLLERLTDEFRKYVNYYVIPVSKLVKIQLASIIASVASLRG